MTMYSKTMDDYDEEDGGEEISINKKFTFFVIDGSDLMAETEDPQSKNHINQAFELVCREMINICCTKSLQNYVGVILTNTNTSGDMENATLLMSLRIPSQDDVNQFKDYSADPKVLKTLVTTTGGSSETCDLASVFNFCKRQFSSCPNTRHQSVIYFTNNTNPFERDDYWESSHFRRTKAAVAKIIGSGQRKTLGEFSVILMPSNDDWWPEADDEEKLQQQPWYQLDTDVFNKTLTMERRIRQKTTGVRSHATVKVTIAPGADFDVSVYSLVAPAEILPSTTQIIESRQNGIDDKSVIGSYQQEEQWKSKANSMKPVSEVIRHLKSINVSSSSPVANIPTKTVVLGSNQVDLTTDEVKKMSRIENKGIDLIGFCSINEIDRECSPGRPKFIRPNEESCVGSTRVYRALLDRCFARQQAMICKYQSRTNEKIRLVALIPVKKTEIEEDDEKKPDLKKLQMMRSEYEGSEFFHEGFHVVPLPYKDEIRDDSEIIGQLGEEIEKLPKPQTEEMNATKNFVKKLTMSYNPTFYENPRILSQRAALCERATGEEVIKREDTLVPYHKKAMPYARVKDAADALVDTYSLNNSAPSQASNKRAGKKEEPMEGESSSKKKKEKESKSIRQIMKDGMMNKLTVTEMADKCAMLKIAPKKKVKKDDYIELLTNYLTEHPEEDFNVEIK